MRGDIRILPSIEEVNALPRPTIRDRSAVRRAVLINERLRPDFKRAWPTAGLALAGAVASRSLGGIHAHELSHRLGGIGAALVFVLFAVIAVRSVANELANVSAGRFGEGNASAVRVLVSFVGFAVIALALLGVLGVPLGRLLVSGAITGVLLGIAAQQSLANGFAGLVLLLTRPFTVGDRIDVHSGSLAGTYTGRVRAMGLTYVTLDVDSRPLLLPNAALLSAAVGVHPADEREILLAPRRSEDEPARV